ncbi:NAD(P)H-dependent oxidoreductase [Haloferula sp. BvORR071]|uniref:NAD(P)H-dependent oxidoreductase n=1 Tax=Haloferula sp. BvORR071 TaxID=1396141 RepID=UPI00054ECC94|nr:NAD(P)H-dependent oxidoreductase [Haloferula sp. BvORR071]
MTPEKLIESLQFRYATKKFDAERKIPAEIWAVLEHSLVLTPSSFGLQPWKFLVIDSPEVRADLSKKSWGQSQVTDASHLVVFTTRTDMTEADVDRLMDSLSSIQSRSPESLSGYRNVITGFAAAMTPEARHGWNMRQTYIALGQFMASAAALGIDTCPLEGLEPAGYDQVLGLVGTGYATSVACAVGYRSAEDKYASTPKARFPLEEIIEHR